MRFTFNGQEYSISFFRQHKELQGIDPVSRKNITFTSKFPYTVVNIEKITSTTAGDTVIKGREIYRTATVGAHHSEEFTYEDGRLAALRSVSRTLDKDFKRALWKAYMGRPRASK